METVIIDKTEQVNKLMDKLNKNLEVYKSKFIKYGFYSEEFFNDFSEKLKLAPYSKDLNGNYPGGMINMTLNITKNILAFNVQLGNKYSDDILIKTVFLSQISKAEMFIFDVENKTINFNSKLIALKSSEHSLRLCNKYNIKVEDEIFQAIVNLDKEFDKQAKFFSTPLSGLLKHVTEWTEFVDKNK